MASLEQCCASSQSIEVPPGEASKSMTSLSAVLEEMLAAGVDRNTVIIALGGGVVGDLAGFAAASLLRGVDYIQIPTSLLAQVDSSVGGKTGVNAKAGKNLIGAFHQPVMVIADIDSLNSLPKRELIAGYAEVMKYGLLEMNLEALVPEAEGGSPLPKMDGKELFTFPGFFRELNLISDDVIERKPAALVKAIMSSCGFKAHVVGMDERESGVRTLLNLGHTFAHALEAAAGYDGKLLHGEAVGIGIALAFELAERMAICRKEHTYIAKEHLMSVGLGTRIGDLDFIKASNAQLIDTMRKDKKAQGGKMRFVLPTEIGHCKVCDDVTEADLEQVLEASR